MSTHGEAHPIFAHMTVYLLPGVGCDRRMYDRIDLPQQYAVVRLEWPVFTGTDTLARIAARMRPQVNADEPHILVGVSMGGMVAQELAALTNPQKVVLISSWTGPQEWTPFVRMSAQLGLHGLIRDWTMRAAWPIKEYLAPRGNDVDQLLWDMACKQTAKQLRHGTGAILRWKGSPWKGHVVRIHGDRDVVTPLRFPVDHLLPGATHVLVMTHAPEVSRLLQHAIEA